MELDFEELTIIYSALLDEAEYERDPDKLDKIKLLITKVQYKIINYRR